MAPPPSGARTCEVWRRGSRLSLLWPGGRLWALRWTAPCRSALERLLLPVSSPGLASCGAGSAPRRRLAPALLLRLLAHLGACSVGCTPALCRLGSRCCCVPGAPAGLGCLLGPEVPVVEALRRLLSALQSRREVAGPDHGCCGHLGTGGCGQKGYLAGPPCGQAQGGRKVGHLVPEAPITGRDPGWGLGGLVPLARPPVRLHLALAATEWGLQPAASALLLSEQQAIQPACHKAAPAGC